LLVKRNNTQIVATCRNAADGDKALEALGRPANVEFKLLDIANDESRAAFAAAMRGTRIDVLVNNAAILCDEALCEEVARRTLATNVNGTFELTTLLLDSCSCERVVMVSSEMGQLKEARFSAAIKKKINAATTTAQVLALGDAFVADVAANTVATAGWRENAYAVSKAILNRLTRVLATENPSVLFTATSPNWCRTDMGGSEAPFSATHGAESILHSVVTPADELGESGLFWQDGERLEF
jgi:NAD(P)-dependent dehydrogenase (short-subunit alcohol dehydrogenase family)